MHAHPHRTGLVFATLFAGVHLAWAILVAVGLAQTLIDFVLWLHFVQPIYVIAPFEVGRAVMLVGFTAVVGYSIGFVGAALWNWLHRNGS